MSKKLDPRVVRTRCWLREALIALVGEKGYVNVQVQDITAHAELNRATFYLHYKDKDELLYDCAKDLFEDVIKRKETSPSAKKRMLKPEIIDPLELVPAFEHFAEYADFYRAVLGENGVPAFAMTVRNHYSELIKGGLVQRMKDADPILIDSIAQFDAAGILGLVTWWLQDAMEQSPEMMATYLAKVISCNLMDFAQ